jgi:hypothetical protein
VHAANLGVRMRAYDGAGGFPAVATGEEHLLWGELGRRGHALCSSLCLRVATSARLDARAPGGFASWLSERLELTTTGR